LDKERKMRKPWNVNEDLVTSPMIREYETLTNRYMILGIVATIFTVVHACMHMWIWFWIGMGLAWFGWYCCFQFAMEVDDQIKITQALENARKQEIKELYGEDDESLGN